MRACRNPATGHILSGDKPPSRVWTTRTTSRRLLEMTEAINRLYYLLQSDLRKQTGLGPLPLLHRADSLERSRMTSMAEKVRPQRHRWSTRRSWREICPRYAGHSSQVKRERRSQLRRFNRWNPSIVLHIKSFELKEHPTLMHGASVNVYGVTLHGIRLHTV